MTPAHADDSPARFCADFAAELRRQRISVRHAAALTHWGKSTIANACHGPRLPQRKLIDDVLNAIGLEATAVEEWLSRYDALARKTDATRTATPHPARTADLARTVWRPFRRQSTAGWIVTTLVVAATTITAVIVLRQQATDPTDRSLTPSAQRTLGERSRTVVVQNQVAFGPSTLTEDDSPEYLSTRPVAKCANIGCKMAGTDMWSGSTLTVVCHVQGELLTNADIDSPGIKHNPNVSASALWYRAVLQDGRRGYVSEVYLAPSYRGGLDLPPC